MFVARAGVAEYWVVDLQNELVERYLPSGADAPSILRAGDQLVPNAYPDVKSTSQPCSAPRDVDAKEAALVLNPGCLRAVSRRRVSVDS